MVCFSYNLASFLTLYCTCTHSPLRLKHSALLVTFKPLSTSLWNEKSPLCLLWLTFTTHFVNNAIPIQNINGKCHIKYTDICLRLRYTVNTTVLVQKWKFQTYKHTHSYKPYLMKIVFEQFKTKHYNLDINQ